MLILINVPLVELSVTITICVIASRNENLDPNIK